MYSAIPATIPDLYPAGLAFSVCFVQGGALLQPLRRGGSLLPMARDISFGTVFPRRCDHVGLW